MCRGGRVIVSIFAISFALDHVALADPTLNEIQAARELFSKAEKDEDAGQWADALDKLRRAASVKVTPGIRFHIALCEEKLGQLVAALADYTAADQSARDQNNKDVADAVAEPLKALRIRVPTLTIQVPDAAGAVVELDGTPIASGLYNVAVPVEPGMHRVQARATGKRPFATQITVHEREAETATIKWVDVPKIEEPTESATREAPPNPDEHASGGVKVGAIVTTITAAALLGLGIGAYVAADGSQSNLFAQCPTLVDCSDLRTQVRAWDAVALGSWIGAAAFTTIAIVLWAKPSHRDAPAASSARVELRPRPSGFALTGSF